MTPLGTALTAAAYAIGVLVFWLAARRRRLNTPGIGYVAAVGLCGGILGAKLTEWLLAPTNPLVTQPMAFLDPRYGGRTVLGGVLCGWAAVEAAKWWLGIRRSTGDLFALALPAAEGVGRLGCFFNGCCYGVPSDAAWAVYQHGCYRHPAQLYAAAMSLAIFVVLYRWRDKMPREGDLFRWYLVLYGAGRFTLEFFRDHTTNGGVMGLSVAQWVCLEMALLAAFTLWRQRARPAREVFA